MKCCGKNSTLFAWRLTASSAQRNRPPRVTDRCVKAIHLNNKGIDGLLRMKNTNLKLAILLTTFVATISAVAQQRSEAPRTFTAADYARAEKMMGYNTTPLVFHSGVRPTWLPDERFWYRITTAEGLEFLLVDPGKGTRAPAFDHAKLAAALSAAAGTTYDAHHLPF